MNAHKTLFVTRPNYDPTTQYCYYWSVPVLTKAKEKLFRILDLAYEKVTKKLVESYLKKHEPELLFFNGHGSPTKLFGQDDESILTKENIGVIPQKSIVYVRSCDVGSKLGKFIVSRAAAFIGYRKSFGFYRNTKYLKSPLVDPLAKFSFEPSNLVVTTMLKGKTAGEAYERSQHCMQKNLQYLLSSKATERERQCAHVLWRNYKYQVLLGNPNASIN